MTIVAWIVLGLVTGLIAGKWVGTSGDGVRSDGVLTDSALGIVGAVVAGWLFRNVDVPGVTGLSLLSIPVAAIGAAVFLVVHHTLSPHPVGER
jgi:uncharacterized membrane protein YeaQ/YmgE (transglycosylase-associated protein family)